MGVLRRFEARYRSPSFKAIRLAGPPIRWLAAAGVISLVVVIGFALVGIREPAILIATPAVAFAIACSLDRDGWRIRMATGELAALQRRRWTSGRLPADPLSAEAWLVAHPDAAALDRAAALVTAGRIEEARVVADAAVGENPEEVVRLTRMRLTVGAAAGDSALGPESVEAFGRLPELAVIAASERRYHLLSLAWSIAWLQIRADRPWRPAFAGMLRRLGPFRPPWPYFVFHAIQQFTLPIAYVLAWLIVSWLGLTDAIR